MRLTINQLCFKQKGVFAFRVAIRCICFDFFKIPHIFVGRASG